LGQKVHPIGFRLGVIKTWDSKWFEHKNYAQWLHEDIRIREFVKKSLAHAGVSKVEIERAANKVKVNVHTARPGIVIGKRGAGIETVKKDLQQFTKNEVFLNIVEVRKAETDAQLVAENIATQLERRMLRSSRWRGDGSLRVVPRGPRAPAHPPRGHRLRLRRGQDHLRQDRLQGLDLPRRGAAHQGWRGRRAGRQPLTPGAAP